MSFRGGGGGGEWNATRGMIGERTNPGWDHVCQRESVLSLTLSPSSQMASNSLRQLPRSFRTNVSRRFYSTPSSSAQQSGEQLQKKATEFAASAQETLNKAWGATKKSLGPLGERLAGTLGCESWDNVTESGTPDASLAYRVPVTYNLQVTREVLRQVYVAERLQIPHWTTFVSEYSLLWSRARNPAFLRELIQSGGWMKVGIYAVEGYGIFKVRSLNFSFGRVGL